MGRFLGVFIVRIWERIWGDFRKERKFRIWLGVGGGIVFFVFLGVVGDFVVVVDCFG